MDLSTELLVLFQQLGNDVFIPFLLSSIWPFALTRVSEMTRKIFFTATKINRVQVMKLGLVAWLLCNFDKWCPGISSLLSAFIPFWKSLRIETEPIY